MEAARFAALLDAYGADPARWPEEERAAALALLATSSDARARQREAAALDAMLGTAPPAPPSDLLVARVLAAAPGAAAAARPATDRARARAAWRRSRRAAIAAAALAAAASLALWIARTPAPETPLAADVIAELSVYGMPGDVLLDVTDVELLGGGDWIDCEAGGLGCLPPDAATPDITGELYLERSHA